MITHASIVVHVKCSLRLMTGGTGVCIACLVFSTENANTDNNVDVITKPAREN